MRSDDKKQLFIQLSETADEIILALSEDQSETLELLVVRHNHIMDALKNSDDHVDISMADAISDANDRIETVISRIKTRQAEIASQLSAVNNRRLIQSAYHYTEKR